MISTHDKAGKRPTRCKEKTFKGNNILKRRDLERWVEEHPDILGEELLVVTAKYDKFDKAREQLDLLAIDRHGKLVVVKLKKR
jgi:RecB family endonuclease NucS